MRKRSSDSAGLAANRRPRHAGGDSEADANGVIARDADVVAVLTGTCLRILITFIAITRGS